MAEGLYEAASLPLDDTFVIASAACDSKTYDHYEFPRPYSYTVHAAQADHFSELVDSPAFSTRRVSGINVSGHWPSDIWLAYEFPPESPGAREQFNQWDGSRWHTIQTEPFNASRREPHQIFDWFDGAKLVAQSRHWHNTVTYRAEPFLVWGKTTHSAPDFSAVSFPGKLERENVEVYYDVSPSREVFVTHVLTTEKPDRTTITIAHASSTGEVRSETVLDTAGFADARIALGRWDERDVAMAWGETLISSASGVVRPWVRRLDQGAWKPFPIPGPAISQDRLEKLWLADEQIWARRGPVVWKFTGKKWVEHLHVPSWAKLSSVLPDGTIWAANIGAVTRFDEQGRAHPVPFIDNPPPSILLVDIHALSVDDVWLRASTGDNEQLFFRTKPMKLLSCEHRRGSPGG